MALRFVDGFDHYVTADITKKWNSNNSGVISSTAGRRGGGSLRWVSGNSNNAVVKTLDAQATWILGVALSVSSVPSLTSTFLRLLDAGTVQCDLRINVDGTLSVTRNGTALTNGTSTFR